MGQEDIYRVLLELKENQGEANAKLDLIKESIDNQVQAHKKLEDRHNALEVSHTNVKTKVGLFSFVFGTISGAITTLAAKYLS